MPAALHEHLLRAARLAAAPRARAVPAAVPLAPPVPGSSSRVVVHSAYPIGELLVQQGRRRRGLGTFLAAASARCARAASWAACRLLLKASACLALAVASSASACMHDVNMMAMQTT